MNKTTPNTPIFNKNAKKCGLLIGINYLKTGNQLYGCINDVINLKNTLVKYCGYTNENLVVLTDDQPNNLPTKQNIIEDIDILVNKVIKENIKEVWFSYSGHGTQVADENNDEVDKQDEAICPLDFQRNGFITDDWLYDNLVKKLPSDVTLIVLMDCCHSGTIMDLPFIFKDNVYQVDSKANTDSFCKTVLISGCKDEQTSADAYINNSYSGALTWAFNKVLQDNKFTIRTKDLVVAINDLMKANNYNQMPTMSSTKYDSLNAYYINEPQIVQPIQVQPVVTTINKLVNVKFETSIDNNFIEANWNVFSVKTRKMIFQSNQTFKKPLEKYILATNLEPGTYILVLRDSRGNGGQHIKITDGVGITLEYKMSDRYREIPFNVLNKKDVFIA